MPANDPDDLHVDADGLAVLTCDNCGEEFTLRVNDALERIARNETGEIFCSRACAARRANERRPRRPEREDDQEAGCRFYPAATGCPMLRTPILGSVDRRTTRFRPKTERELDLCIEIVRASLVLKLNAPPTGDDLPWSHKRRDAWHEASGAHDLAERLLKREVSRRNEER